MATTTVATAAGAVALVYYLLNWRLQCRMQKSDSIKDFSVVGASNNIPLGIDRVSHRLIRAPATWLETIWALSETLRFTYSETLGKWPIGDLAFGISFLLRSHVSGFFVVVYFPLSWLKDIRKMWCFYLSLV